MAITIKLEPIYDSDNSYTECEDCKVAFVFEKDQVHMHTSNRKYIFDAKDFKKLFKMMEE